MQNPDNLYVARFARKLVPQVYSFTYTLPNSERYNLIVQMQKSSSSVSNNLHESCGRKGNRAALQFYYYAYGSATELYRQFKQAREVSLGNQTMARRVGREAGRLKVMIARLIKADERRLEEEGF